MLFQADQGIYLLTRAHEFQFIGSGVEQSMIGATVTSAIVDEIHGRVYFTITTGGASAGKRLIFDYIHKVWTTGDLIEAGPSTLAVPVSAAIIGGAMHVLSATGQIFREDATTNLDGGAWVTATLETGWLKLDGLQGFTRTRDVTVLAEYVTDHDLTLSIGYNNADSYTDVRTFNRAAIAALTTPREQLGISCTRQKNESIRVKIVDVTPTGGTVGVGHGANFIGYAFTVAPKGSTYRLPAANQQ
jgi:hypothetical protein